VARGKSAFKIPIPPASLPLVGLRAMATPRGVALQQEGAVERAPSCAAKTWQGGVRPRPSPPPRHPAAGRQVTVERGLL
jgi:hypothetical protein